MIEYYGQPHTGKPFEPNLVYFAWNPDTQKGCWVAQNSKWVSHSRFAMEMSLPRSWTRVFMCPADEDLQMDEGL